MPNFNKTLKFLIKLYFYFLIYLFSIIYKKIFFNLFFYFIFINKKFFIIFSFWDKKILYKNCAKNNLFIFNNLQTKKNYFIFLFWDKNSFILGQKILYKNCAKLIKNFYFFCYYFLFFC